MMRKKQIIRALAVFMALLCATCGSVQAFAASAEDDRPVIGIAWATATDSEFYTNVFKAVEAAGGQPVALGQVLFADLPYDEADMLTDGVAETGALTENAGQLVRSVAWDGSNVAEVLEGVDAVVFSGGEDISPSLYLEPVPWHGIVDERDYNAERDVSDYLTMAYCLDMDIPFMGFCRGMQMLGVLSGGTVIQDIPTYFAELSTEYDYTHRNQKETPDAYRNYASHEVRVAESDSILYNIVGTDAVAGCPSWHHQAVKSVEGTPLNVTGVTPTCGVDMIEALERTDKPFAVGFQFHPEMVIARTLDGADDTERFMDYDTALAFYQALVEAASKEKSALLSEYWAEGSEVAASLSDYIQSVTDETSPDYIPVEDRIAVFDLDGTLMCETYPFCFEYMVFADYALTSDSATITDDVRAVAREIVDAAGGKKPDGMSTRQASAGAIAYQGMTIGELAAVVDAFKDSEAWGFSGMTRGEAYYKPMVELFDALLENDFTVYIVTATERNIVREVIRGTLDIPPSHVIGTEYGYTATNQGDEADTDYTFQPSDQIVFDGTYAGENAKTSKVDAIVREIGQQPVLAFGNSSGDLAMEIYTISDNPYRSAAYMVLADDEAREYGSASAAGKRASYEDMGIEVISMRDDWNTIYGENVIKTGEFHQAEAYAKDIAPANAVAEEAEVENTETDDVQYVMYLGTNDKDTNTPVFTQAEAIERAREILIQHFGGYTIQEAHGGWIDDGTVYQEYTLVIYLSDTRQEAVHAAADELIEAFHQSSVLIQANPTRTEFYGGAE